MRLRIEAELYYTLDAPADVLLQVEAAAMADQRLLASELRVSAGGPIVAVPGDDGVGQRTWAPAASILQLDYVAEVEITRAARDFSGLPAAAPSALPAATIPYLLPSRYCEVERFHKFVHGEFAGLNGGALVRALADWVQANLHYASDGAAPGVTTAADTFAARRGVCRDYAHLLVSFARAADIPDGLRLCARPPAARFSRGGGGLAGRRLAPDRRDRDGGLRRYRAGGGRARCDRYRVHDDLRHRDHAAAGGAGDAGLGTGVARRSF